jgi:hypothetical protein
MGRGGGVNPIERLARKIAHRKIIVCFTIRATLRARGAWRRHQRRCLREDIASLRDAYAAYAAANGAKITAAGQWGQHA